MNGQVVLLFIFCSSVFSLVFNHLYEAVGVLHPIMLMNCLCTGYSQLGLCRCVDV